MGSGVLHLGSGLWTNHLQLRYKHEQLTLHKQKNALRYNKEKEHIKTNIGSQQSYASRESNESEGTESKDSTANRESNENEGWDILESMYYKKFFANLTLRLKHIRLHTLIIVMLIITMATTAT